MTLFEWWCVLVMNGTNSPCAVLTPGTQIWESSTLSVFTYHSLWNFPPYSRSMSDAMLNHIIAWKNRVRKDSKRQSTSFSCPNFICVAPERQLSDVFLENFSSRDCRTWCSPFYHLCWVTSEMLSEVNTHIALCMLESYYFNLSIISSSELNY